MSETTTEQAKRIVDEAAAAGLLEQLETLVNSGNLPTETTKQELSEPSPKQTVEALLENGGLTFTKGKIELVDLDATLQAVARVAKTGRPEVVRASDKDWYEGLAIWREANGSVALQRVKVS